MRRLALFLLLILLSLSSHAKATSPTLEEQRRLFLDAEQALDAGRISTYRSFKKRLGDYPLVPYLEQKELKRRFRRLPKKDVAAFLEKYKGTPVADELRQDWLEQLARKGHWKSYLKFYTPQSDVGRQCKYVRALIRTGKAEQGYAQVKRLWLDGRSQPSTCDGIFAAWEKKGFLTRDLIWARIELAMEKNNWRLARYLSRKLSPNDRRWVTRWTKLHRSPHLAKRLYKYTKPHPYRDQIMAHTIKRLSVKKPLEALEHWQKLKAKFSFAKGLITPTERYLGLMLEREKDPRAFTFVQTLPLAADDERLLTAKLRSALVHSNWSQVIMLLEKVPSKEVWQYWLARAYQETGQTTKAKLGFELLANERSYYGFLAADIAKKPYHLAHTDTPVSQLSLDKQKNNQGIQRAIELHEHERFIDARREWNYATKGLVNGDLQAASLVAEEAGWHDQAIFTLAKTAYWDDLELRFPLHHNDLINEAAKDFKLDPSWIYAVIRQESAFRQDARSHVGAVGLMQLMPSTARRVAKGMLNQRAPKTKQLLEAETNISLGSAYLNQLSKQYDGNIILATAGYNAGPLNVDRWLGKAELPADVWVELIPFHETHRYVRSVLSYMVIYDKRRGKKISRLSDRIKAIPKAED
jgi:soluble lytic murein transglycosylase